MKLIYLILSFCATLSFFSCSKEVEFFDFTPFEEKGWSHKNSIKYLTYISYRPNDSAYLYAPCFLEYKGLKPYLNSPKHDILFVIETNPKDTVFLKKHLKSKKWCYEKFLVVYETPEFFKKVKGVKGISYIFDNDGKVIALSNPSLKNFKTIMDRHN